MVASLSLLCKGQMCCVCSDPLSRSSCVRMHAFTKLNLGYSIVTRANHTLTVCSGCTRLLPGPEKRECPRFDRDCEGFDSIGARGDDPRAPEAGAWWDHQARARATNSFCNSPFPAAEQLCSPLACLIRAPWPVVNRLLACAVAWVFII